jgi:hypoxanthine phosphoribosyltransferase
MSEESKQPQVEMLFSAAEIAARVDGLAEAIAAAMGPDITIVAVLKGSFVFAADLLRALFHKGVHPRVDFMTLASYGAGTEGQEPKILRDISEDVSGRRVLLIDDILESGRTLAAAKATLAERGAAEVRLCVLLHKPGKRRAQIDADFVGFETPDRFVVGYGLDYAHFHRELPYIGFLRQAG